MKSCTSSEISGKYAGGLWALKYLSSSESCAAGKSGMLRSMAVLASGYDVWKVFFGAMLEGERVLIKEKAQQ